VVRHRKSCSRSSAEGTLKEYTRQPCGFTPDMTCLIVLSFPAASMACQDHENRPLILSVEFPCMSDRREIPRCSVSCACSFDFNPSVSPGSKCFRRKSAPSLIRNAFANSRGFTGEGCPSQESTDSA